MVVNFEAGGVKHRVAFQGPGNVNPEKIKTDFAKYLWEDGKGAAVAQTYPLKRLGEPDDIGEAALYFAAGATWVTGQTLVLDGGGLIDAKGASTQE